jgi:hypothetical protein
MRKFAVSFFFLIILVALFLPPKTSAAPGNNPIFATVDFVQDLFDQAWGAIQHNQSDIEFLKERADNLQAQVDEINSTPSPTPSPDPTPDPEALPPIELVLADGREGSFQVPFEVPEGYDLLTFNVSSTGSIVNWAARVIIAPETITQEQHRFRCSGSSVCPPGSVPVLGTDYVFAPGTSSGFVSASVTMDDIPGAQTMVLGSHVNLNFVSNPFDTTGFSSILITAGQNNPQNLNLISLQKFNGATFDRVGDLVCDGGAECPATIQPLLGGDYRVLVEGVGGFGLDALVGAILLP